MSESSKENSSPYRYKCQDCGFNFLSESIENLSCPKCSSSLLEEIVGLAGLWFLGDWFNIWGDD